MQSLEWTAFDRIRQFEIQLATIRSSDFIRKSTDNALEIISSAVGVLRADIVEAAALDDKSYLIQKAVTVNQKLFLFTNYLGILLRSTNTRNCFEAYFSLSTIVEQLTGKENLLVISSEWDASPFYIQQPPEALKHLFFIGFPAFASRNALLLPLAAHEIGHAIWRLNEVEGTIYTTAEFHIKEYIDNNKKLAISSRSLFEKIDEEEFLSRSLTLIISQAQEMFCDLFGSYLFKKSYSYAFEQYLAPGFGKRDMAYPSFQHRIRYIRTAAFEELEREAGLLDDGAMPSVSKPSAPEALAADEVIEKLQPAIAKIVKKILQDADLLAYSIKEEEKIVPCLESGVPPQAATSPIAILNAIWHVYLKRIETIGDVSTRHKFTDFTNNLCMKSLEIIEYSKIRSTK